MESCQFRDVDFARRFNVAVRSHISWTTIYRDAWDSAMDYKPNDGIMEAYLAILLRKRCHGVKNDRYVVRFPCQDEMFAFWHCNL